MRPYGRPRDSRNPGRHPPLLPAGSLCGESDPYKPEIWDTYREIGKKYEAEGLRETAVQKPEFYPRGAKCYACIATGETALYTNIILKKGVVK